MAAAEQIPTELTLDVGDDLSPEEFLTAVGKFLGYVAEATHAQCQDGPPIEWTVRVREGSALIGVEPDAGTPPSALAAFYAATEKSLEAMARGDMEGAGLSGKAMRYLRSLSKLAAGRGSGGIKVWVQRRPFRIGAEIAQTVDGDWQRDYHDYGTVEGTLEAIRGASGSLHIRIRDILHPDGINCSVPEDLLGDVLGNFRRRVEVEGRIHYRRDGTPISIRAQAIDAFPDDSDLPTADEVRGILADQ